MRNRTLALLLGATLAFGGLVACSDDDDSDDSTELEDVDSGDDSDDSGDSSDSDSDDSGDSEASGDVEAYCDAVADFVESAQEVMANPTDADAVAEVTEQGSELSEQGAALGADAASLSEDELQRLQECTAEIAEGLTPG